MESDRAGSEQPAPTADGDEGDAASAGGMTTASLRPAWAWTTATTVLLGAVAFVVSPIAANALGPTGRGRLVVVQLAPQLLADLASIGLGFAVVHFGAQRTSSVRSLLRWSIRPLVVGSLAMFGLGQALAGPLAGGSADDERLMRWYLLLCPIIAFATVPIEALRALGQFRTWNAFILARGLSWPLSLLVAVLFFTDPLRFVVVAHLTVLLVVLVAVWVVVLARTSGLDDEPTATTRRYVGYGAASALSTIPRSANAKLDQLIMTGMVGRDNLGLYAAAVGWSALTLPVMRGLASITMPLVSGASDRDRPRRAAQLVTIGFVAVGLLSAGGMAATALLWGPLYGDDFRPALSAALVLIPAAVLLELNAVLGNVLRSLERPVLVAVLEAGALGLSAVALLVTLRYSEVLGPAIVSLVTYALASVLYVHAIARRLGVRDRDLIEPGAVRTVLTRRTR